jgi:hypothetical protein
MDKKKDLDDKERMLSICKIVIDKTKCMTDEEFKKADKEFDLLYNSSPEMKKLINSWNGK